jgi:hypothetical protein
VRSSEAAAGHESEATGVGSAPGEPGMVTVENGAQAPEVPRTLTRSACAKRELGGRAYGPFVTR